MYKWLSQFPHLGPWRGDPASRAAAQLSRDTISTANTHFAGSQRINDEVIKPHETEKTMSGMFDYVKFDDTREVKQATMRAHADAFWRVVEANLAPGPERTKAQNKLQEAWMWMGKALKAEQLAGDRSKAGG